jgi:uncharacterized protein (TIGR02246 family)
MALAQEPDGPVESARIRSVIAELNKARTKYDGKAFSQLFARDGTVRIGREIVATGQAAIEKTVTKPLPWSETTAPMIDKESVRFLSSDVARVDAVQVQYGPVVLKQAVPIRILLKLERNECRIVSMVDRFRPGLPTSPSDWLLPDLCTSLHSECTVSSWESGLLGSPD